MKKILSMTAILMLVNVFGCGGEEPTTITEDTDTVEYIQDSVVEEEVVEEISPEWEEDISTLEAIIVDETADSDDCTTITDEEIKKTCEQKFIYDQAVTDKNKDMCGELENTGDQEMCVAEVE